MIVAVSADAIRHVAENMRQADREEIAAASGLPPLECLECSVDVSAYSWAIVAGGETIALAGLVKDEAGMGEAGVPWLLGTGGINKHRKLFYQASRQLLDAMLAVSPRLINFVHAKNTTSLRYLDRLGFRIEAPQPFGVAGELFHRFQIGASDV